MSEIRSGETENGLWVSVCSNDCVLRCLCNSVCFCRCCCRRCTNMRWVSCLFSHSNSLFLSNIPTSASSPHPSAAACLNPACDVFSPRCVCVQIIPKRWSWDGKLFKRSFEDWVRLNKLSHTYTHVKYSTKLSGAWLTYITVHKITDVRTWC